MVPVCIIASQIIINCIQNTRVSEYNVVQINQCTELPEKQTNTITSDDDVT